MADHSSSPTDSCTIFYITQLQSVINEPKIHPIVIISFKLLIQNLTFDNDKAMDVTSTHLAVPQIKIPRAAIIVDKIYMLHALW